MTQKGKMVKREKMVKVSVPESLKRKIKSCAALQGLSISGYIKKLVR